MPPDPILGLMCFIGLIAYSAIGGVVGATVLRIMSPDTYHRFLAGARSYSYEYEVWWSFFPVVAFWPVILALLIPLSLAAGVLTAPWWISKKVGAYTAKAQLGES